MQRWHIWHLAPALTVRAWHGKPCIEDPDRRARLVLHCAPSVSPPIAILAALYATLIGRDLGLDAGDVRALAAKAAARGAESEARLRSAIIDVVGESSDRPKTRQNVVLAALRALPSPDILVVKDLDEAAELLADFWVQIETFDQA